MAYSSSRSLLLLVTIALAYEKGDKRSSGYLAVPVKGPVGGADGTLAVYAINSFIVLFQKTQINLPWTRKDPTTTASIPSAFFLSFFFLVTVVGNTTWSEKRRRLLSTP